MPPRLTESTSGCSDCARLRERNGELQERNDALQERNGELEAKVSELTEELRQSKRQAAPYSKGNGKQRKRKPGRKAEQGTFVRRSEPEVKPTDQVEKMAAPLDARQCPQCGEEMEARTEAATITDVPEEPVRVIKRFDVEVGLCRRCGITVRGRHEDLAEDQFGASAHRVGVNVSAQALALHYHNGLPLRKVPEVIETCTGIALTQGGLTQKAGKLCQDHGRLGRVYEKLRQEIKTAPVVNTDDTGWRTGGQPSYLMGFFAPMLAVYQVRDQHRHQEVLEVLGENFRGKLGTDRGTSYEAKALEEVEQQKCLSHLLKNLSEVEQTKTGRARQFSKELKVTLRRGLDLWKDYTAGKISEEEFRERGEKIRDQLDWQLRDRSLSDVDNQRLLDGIGMQNDRGRVLLFLKHPEIEPTNNRAERGLRPAVIARKVSQCSKNATGAKIYETMKSITETLKLRDENVARGLADLIKGHPLPTSR